MTAKKILRRLRKALTLRRVLEALAIVVPIVVAIIETRQPPGDE